MAAINGTMALKIAEARMPDLILLDVMMPEMDGYELCKRLKSNAKTSAIPVVFVTAMDEATDKAKGLALGAVAYVMKPVDPTLLRESVSRQLS
jgi:CheY-like chemotaxis protein